MSLPPLPETLRASAAAKPPSAGLVSAVRTLLAPLLRWQAARLRRSTPALTPPSLPSQGKAGVGFSRLRLLVVGDSCAIGVGVDAAAQSLVPQLEQALSRQLSAGPMGLTSVSWQLVGRTGLSSHNALALLAATQLQPADVLVTVLGLNDIVEISTPARWLHSLDALRSHAKHRAKVRYTVHCAPPRLDLMPQLRNPLRWLWRASAARLDGALRSHLRHAHRRSRLAFPYDPARDEAAQWLAADGVHPNAALYQRWAQAVAERIELELLHNPSSGAVLPTGFTHSGYAQLEEDQGGYSQFGSGI